MSELLRSALSLEPASCTDPRTRLATVTAYLEDKATWSESTRAAIAAGLEQLSRNGLEIGPGRISFVKVRRLDWAEAWKRHFRPLSIGTRLLIKPSWSRRRPRRGQAVVVLDPGLSFGTGQHPTTAFCLRELTTHRRTPVAQSFLDLGTGSGILAIAAAKLGYSPIEAMDLDPDAIRVSRANARRNGVLRQIRFRRADITRLATNPTSKFFLVCANLISSLLLQERERIMSRLELGGVLVLAGILRSEFIKVRSAYERAGLRLIDSQAQGEWRSGSFRSR